VGLPPMPNSLRAETGHARPDQIFAAQVRLLYSNLNLGTGVTVVAALVLGRLEWAVVPHSIIIGWCLYMLLVSGARFILGRRYGRAEARSRETRRWSRAFTFGAGLAGAGWGAAAILLYPEGSLAYQVFLVFILGGMMLGAVSQLAPRVEAFLAFIVPTGLAPAVRLVAQGDEAHLAMGLLAGLFTVALLVTTRRINLTIVSSLSLQVENQDLVQSLQIAKSHVEVLNEQLAVRVQQRTAELQRSMEQLQAETSERERIEEELLRARKLESLGVLAGGIAHDFNNFLTIVQGNIELAKMRLDPDESIYAILDQTERACQQAAFLSSQLLTFAKGGSPVRRLVSVAQLVMDAVQLARAGAQISIEVSIADDLWCAEVDPGQIGQVLHNILLNARQAMPDGGIVEVHAENARPEDAPDGSALVSISIRDYGCGIPAEILPRIFDPYFTTKAGGTGLGLATAYAIIAKHGGTLSVESKPGDGAAFTIDLPASKDRPAGQAPVAARMQSGTERVLVMDDEEALRTLLAAILTQLGYEVLTARDGAETIALCENAEAAGRSLDAVLLDVTVSGGMGGVEAAARLKQLDPSLKLIVSSGYSESPVMSDYRQYGFDDVLPKPWAVADVSEVFRRVLIRSPHSRR
jgi:signal transduction histidine kinase/ActR/RegA family two-component response regulator